MPSTLVSILLHVTFSTKHRNPLITPEIEPAFHRHANGIITPRKCRLLAIGGMPDHVHLAVSMSKNLTIVDLMEDFKRATSLWFKQQGPRFADFYWQEGYAAFSIGQSGLKKVTTYIAKQREHHRRETFQDELRTLLGKYEIEFDERYIWD